MKPIFLITFITFFGIGFLKLFISLFEKIENNEKTEYYFQKIQENERRLEEEKRKKEALKPNEVPASYSEINNTNDNSNVSSNFEKTLPEPFLTDKNDKILSQINENNNIKDFLYFCEKAESHSHYTFYKKADGKFANQYLLLYNSSGLSKEVLLINIDNQLIAFNEVTDQILTKDEFEALYNESVEFLNSHSYYTTEIKKNINQNRLEKIITKIKGE